MADKTLPPIAIGDSLADGIRTANNLEGNTRWGAGPKEVFEKIQEFAAKNSLAGRDVFIGTGMPNIPEQKKYVEQQIDFVRKQGGNPILIGVGPGTKKKPTTGQNEFLAGLAERKGLTYMGPLVNMFPDVTKDPMGLHLRAPQYKQLFKQFSQSQAQPQPQPKAQPQVQQVQPQSRESSAADLLAQFTGAVMQAESRGKRYDKSGKLLTSSKGAQGEMQVMPGTSTDPGFGVKPAKDNSPEEIARVGRDYAAVMLRRYNNNPTLAAVAYNWGPGNADRWIKGGADINKLPAETRNYVVRIAGNMGAPISVPTVAQPSPALNKRADVRPVPPAKRVSTTGSPRAEAPVDYVPLGATLDTAPRSAEQQNVVTRADMERLGPSYQAALAATTLADSRDDEDDYDDEDTIAERYMERRSEQLAEDDSTLEEEPTRTSSLADLDLTYQSPFAQEEPVMMAHGGVVHRADGSPIYGEGIDLSDSGGLTAQTRQNFFKGPKFNAREALSMLGQIGREGVSNLESTLRGSVAAIPGFVGDVESGFRDDKSRKYMTTEEVKRDVLPSRMTTPTKDAAGYEELGTYLPLPVTPQQVLPPRVVKNLITKAKGMLPAKEVDTFPMGKLSAEEVLQQLKSFDPKELEKAKEAFLASSAEKRRMYHGTLMAPEGKTVVDKRLPDFYKTVGTDQGFTSFKPGTGGMTFVTPNPEFTDLFTGMRFAGKGNTSPSRVYPVYVQVKKPFDFENAKHVDELAAEVSAAVRKNKGKKDLAWWMTSDGKPVSTDSVRRLLSTGQWGFIEDPIVLDAAKKLGFDGMYMMEAGTKNLGVFDPKKIKSATGNEGSFNVRDPDIRKAHGGIVHRAEGSPVYGEGVDLSNSGGITAETVKNLLKGPKFNAREALALLRRIAGEGVSNLESVARGSVAGVPGVVGDIESIFRDDKKRKFATSTEVERQYLPKRFTAPTKESQAFVEIGTAIDPSIALKAAPKTAKATLKALKESGPQVEAALMKVAPAAEPMNIVKYEGGNWMPTRERSDVVNDYINNLLKDTRVGFDLDFKKKMQSIAESRLASAKNLLAESNQSTKRIYQQNDVASASRKKKIEMAEGIKPIKGRHREEIVEAQKLVDEAKDQTAIPQSISDFIEKKLQPYIRNKLGTSSDQIRTGMDKWELEIQPRLIAEKQKQIDKVRADINRAAAARGNIDPLILTRSQEQLRKLMNEMEGIKSRTGSFFQMERPAMEALVRRYDNPTTLNYSVLAKNRQIGLGATDSPETLVKAKSTAGKAWENTVDSSIDAYTPSEAASEYASIYGKEPPAWLTKAEQSTDQKGIFSLPYRSGETLASQFRHMIDEIRSSMYPQTNTALPKDLRITPKDLEKMSVEDVSALVDKINGWRASNIAGVDLARANTPAVTEIKAYKTIPNTDLPNEKNLRWVEIKMPEGIPEKEGKQILDDALKYEGEIMKHCVGAYCPKVEEGTKIFSLRDDAGRPYTTIEAAPDMNLIDDIFKKELGEGAKNWAKAPRKEVLDTLVSELGYEIPYEIKQIKGVRNGAPVEEAIPFVRDFVSDPKWTDVADLKLIGGL